MIIESLSIINQMLADGIISRYAIGGAIGATFYLEPVSTVDLDIFIALEPQPGQFLISLQPIYDYLKSKNAVPEGEYILISGWPVQFLVPNSPLVEEALQKALESDVDGESVWVFRPEYLAAIALQTGRGKDKSRLLEFIEQDALDFQQFEKLVQNHHLTDNGVCQGSCQVSHAADHSESGRFTGFKATVPMGVQLRVLPDQRPGFLALAVA